MTVAFPHLFELLQTFLAADGFCVLIQPQHEWLAVTRGAAILTDRCVVPSETFQAGVAAKLVDGFIQGQLACGLKEDVYKGAVST